MGWFFLISPWSAEKGRICVFILTILLGTLWPILKQGPSTLFSFLPSPQFHHDFKCLIFAKSTRCWKNCHWGTTIVTEQIDSFDQLLSHCHLFVGLKASKVDVNDGKSKKFHSLQQKGEHEEMCTFQIPRRACVAWYGTCAWASLLRGGEAFFEQQIFPSIFLNIYIKTSKREVRGSVSVTDSV